MAEPRNPLLRLTDSLMDRILCVGGAVASSQMPEFIQQYAQRLGGHLDEAQRQLAQFQRTAEQSGLTLPQYIERASANSDAAIAKLGGVISASTERVESLTSAMTALQTAGIFERPFAFLQHIDSEIAQATWSAYKPAVPTTGEGLVYALLGMGVALMVYHLGIALPLSRFFRKRATLKLAHK